MKIRNFNNDSQAVETFHHAVLDSSTVESREQAALGAMLADDPAEPELADRQALEIALLRARVQHLELVIETARSLLNANQDRLLRRLHEIPRELVSLTTQLQRIDPQTTW
jgi:hypothetical protein